MSTMNTFIVKFGDCQETDRLITFYNSDNDVTVAVIDYRLPLTYMKRDVHYAGAAA